MNGLITKLKTPHLLLASSNSRKLIKNVEHILDAPAIRRLDDELNRNVADLFRLGESHLAFASPLSDTQWRQVVSRLYYAALNIKRALSLHYSGEFFTDSTDHKKIGDLPDGFPNLNTYASKLANLRDDRNIADYGHTAVPQDLLIPLADARKLVAEFRDDVKNRLSAAGIAL